MLDRRRLGKQRVEVLTMLKALADGDPTAPWRQHPATRMWEERPGSLIEYGIAVCQEWQRRGFKDSVLAKIVEFQAQFSSKTCRVPDWLGLPEFHIAHQSNLLRKDSGHYRQYFPHVPDDLDYWWPVTTPGTEAAAKAAEAMHAAAKVIVLGHVSDGTFFVTKERTTNV